MEIIEDSHPIFKACYEGNAEIVDSYIREGVSVYAKGEMTPSLVGTATSLGHLDVLRVLLSHGLDPNRPAQSVFDYAADSINRVWIFRSREGADRFWG